MKILLSDGRLLIGTFLCTDKDRNVILGACTESLAAEEEDGQEEEVTEKKKPNPRIAGEPRNLGLAMVPGKHIVSIQIDDDSAKFS